MNLHSVILFCASTGMCIHLADYLEGSSITLSCNFSDSVDNLHWYRQYGRSKPEFLVLTYSSAKEAQRSDVDPRFTVKVEKREHVDLKISSAAVSDSALYYCALQPTVTGNTSALYKNLLQ
uniref:T-cell receptor alpha/delta variable 36.2.12 n=1 Tax=Sinocyclocheilus anshuiensis TaxID=1608454 RepID=A0A671SUY3_9TELE